MDTSDDPLASKRPEPRNAVDKSPVWVPKSPRPGGSLRSPSGAHAPTSMPMAGCWLSLPLRVIAHPELLRVTS